MTVSTTTRRAGPFAGNGVTTSFPFTFKIFEESDLAVYVVDEDGNEELLTLDSDYSVSLNADQDANPGGSISYPVLGDELATGYQLYALSAIPIEQATDFTNLGRFFPRTHEDAFDKAIAILQQLQEVQGRSLVIPSVDDQDADPLPPASSRLDKMLGFDAGTGQPEVSTFTMTQVAAVVAAVYAAAAGPLDALSFIQSGTGAVSRTAQDKAREWVSVTDFMTPAQVADCRSEAATLDVTDAIQAAIDSHQAIFFPPGKYRVVCKPTSVFDYGNATNDVFRAVDIQKNNLTLLGHHATIRVIGNDPVGTAEINYAFATNKNMSIGDMVNFQARGLKFDFDPTGDGSSTKRSFYFGGVEGIVLDDITITSSGTRAGGTMTFQQCRSIRIDNFTLKNCTQGMNFSYCYDIVGSNWRFDNFSEAVDFDRVVFGLKLSNLVFRNATGGQCLDLNSVQDVSITGINVDGVGNVAIVNYKDTTQATYADYVNNAAVGGVFTISKNVTLQQISGRDCAGIQLGFDRTAGYVGGGPCERLVLRDVNLVNVSQPLGAPLRIEDVRDFVLDNVYMENCTSSSSSTSWGAITIEADTTYADAHVSGTMRNVRVNGCNLKGTRVSAPSRLVFDGVEIENFNTSNTANHGFAYDLQTLNNRSGIIHIDRTLAKTGQNSPVAWRFSESGAGSFESEIHWGRGNRIDTTAAVNPITTPIAFGQAGTQRRIKKRVLVPIGTFSLAAGTKDYPLLRPGEGEGMYLCYVSAHVTQDWAGHATDYLTTDVRTVISAVAASVATANFTAALTAGAEKDLSVAFNETAVKLAEGDIALLRIGRNAGTPSMEGLMADVRYIDYATS